MKGVCQIMQNDVTGIIAQIIGGNQEISLGTDGIKYFFYALLYGKTIKEW